MGRPFGKITMIAVGLLLVATMGWGGRSIYRRQYRLPDGQNCEGLSHLHPGDAAKAAADDAKGGKVHLLGVQGYTIELPGLTEQHGDLAPSNYRVEVLPCTTDAPLSVRHQRWIERGRTYAQAYNQATLSVRGAAAPKFGMAHGQLAEPDKP